MLSYIEEVFKWNPDIWNKKKKIISANIRINKIAYTGFWSLPWIIRRMPYLEQELPALPKHPAFLPIMTWC